MDRELPVHVVQRVRDSSRLNARTLRNLAAERDAYAASLIKRADEIDQIADELDRYIKSLEDHG